MNAITNFLNSIFSCAKKFYLNLYVCNFYYLNRILIWNIAIRRSISFWFLISKLLIVWYFIQLLQLNKFIIIFFFIIFQIIDFLYLDDKVSKENVERLYENLRNKTLLGIVSIVILVLSIYSLCMVV